MTATKQSVQETKEKIVDKILSNSVYQPESGLVRHLRQQMLKLPKSDLDSLNLLIEIKCDDAAGGAK